MKRQIISSKRKKASAKALIVFTFLALPLMYAIRYNEAKAWVNEYPQGEKELAREKNSMILYLKGVYEKGNIYDRNNVLMKIDEDTKAAFGNLIGKDIEHTFVSQYTIEGRFAKYLYGLEADYLYPKPVFESERKGGDITLTVDSKLQKEIFKLLETYPDCGEAIVINYRTGEILAAVSNKKTEYHSVFWELKNPGSTIKPVLGSILVENGKSEYTYDCTGKKEKAIQCYNGSKHGQMNLEKALNYSCNKYFVSSAEQLSLEVWKQELKKFGFGAKENDTYSLAYSDSEFIEKDQKDIPYQSYIGQENCKVSLYGLCKAYMPFYNQGSQVQPKICNFYQIKGGDKTQKTKSEVKQIVSPETADTIKTFLRTDVTEGICKNFEVEGLEIGGKTGTADTSNNQEHLWAVGGSSNESTPYVVGVCLSNQPYGSPSSKAGAILNEIFMMLTR